MVKRVDKSSGERNAGKDSKEETVNLAMRERTTVLRTTRTAELGEGRRGRQGRGC